MEAMDAPDVAAWLEEMKLDQYVGVVQKHEIDGDMLADLLERDNLHLLGIEDGLHQSKLRASAAKLVRLSRKREAEHELSETTVKKKRPNLLSDRTPSRAGRENAEPVQAEQPAAGGGALDAGSGGCEPAPKIFSQSSKYGTIVYATDPAANLECAVCLQPVPEDPCGLSNRACDHFFCRSCLLLSLKAHRLCPCCRTPAGDGDLESLVARSRLAASVVDNLDIHCPKGCVEQVSDKLASWASPRWSVDHAKCTAIMKMGGLDSHLSTCPYAEVDCPHKDIGCNSRVLRLLLNEHAAQCWYAQGAEHIKEWGKRVGLMEGQLTQLNEKLQTAQTLLGEESKKTAWQISKQETQMAVLGAHQKRMGALARQLCRERAGMNPAMFGIQLAQLPEPNPQKLKAFIESDIHLNVSWTDMEQEQLGTVAIRSVGAFADIRDGQQLTRVTRQKANFLAMTLLLPLCPTITELALSHLTLGPTEATGLFTVLPQCVMLRTLSIKLSDTCQGECKLLGDMLARCNSLESLTVSACHFLERVYKTVADLVKLATSDQATPDTFQAIYNGTPEHQHALAIADANVGWTCDACGSFHAQQEEEGEGEGGLRYRCTLGCDWDMCGTCWDANSTRHTSTLSQPVASDAVAHAFVTNNWRRYPSLSKLIAHLELDPAQSLKFSNSIQELHDGKLPPAALTWAGFSQHVLGESSERTRQQFRLHMDTFVRSTPETLEAVSSLVAGLSEISLHTLKFYISNVDDESWARLAPGLPSSLKELSVNLPLTPSTKINWALLSPPVARMSQLESLILSGPSVSTLTEARELAQLMSSCSSTVKVFEDGGLLHGVDDDLLVVLAPVWPRGVKSLTLNLYESEIGSRGWQAICTGVARCSQLEDLTGCFEELGGDQDPQVNDEGATLSLGFGEHISKYFCARTLGTLVIPGSNGVCGIAGSARQQSNPLLPPEHALAAALPKIPRLKSLTFDSCAAGDGSDFLQTLATTLPFCHKLESLSFSESSLDDGGAQALFEVLQDCTHLKSLSMYESSVDDAAGMQLASALSRHPSLESLDVAFNNFRPATVRAILETLPENKLEKLEINFPTDEEEYAWIMPLLRRLPASRTLSLIFGGDSSGLDDALYTEITDFSKSDDNNVSITVD